MDYLELILQGYFNPNTNKHLPQYFLREYRKAEKEYYSPREFFGGCHSAIAHLKELITRQVQERKKELHLMLSAAKAGTLKYNDLAGKTIEQKRTETIEGCEKELADERPNGIGVLSFTAHLFNLYPENKTIPLSYSMSYDEIVLIEFAVNGAWEILNLPKATDKLVLETSTKQIMQGQRSNKAPKPTSNAPKPFHEYLNHSNKEALAEGLKKEFSTEKGRDIKRLLELLREQELITWGTRQFKALHTAMELYFDRDIGTYQSINDFRGWNDHAEENKPIQERIKRVLNSL